ncbi:MAG TPA: TIGR02466 family protein [Bdellovibrionota bacterium]|jgi:uncharacterized protein (TIGR02466 family)|nr:TIGR02466 family protein [Bdellovibrionota bacterium]
MSVKHLFATPIYFAPLCPKKSWASLGKRLLKDAYRIEAMDEEGSDWSELQYPGGYTSYSSIPDLHERSTDFIALRKLIDKHVYRFVRALEYNVDPRTLQMNSSWINITRRGGHHSMHLHPQSVISGTIYLATPKNSGNLKFEDPRLSKFMAAPARKENAKLINQTFVEFEPRAGHVVLFESWLRHEVEPNLTANNRVSLSFNYSNF